MTEPTDPRDTQRADAGPAPQGLASHERVEAYEARWIAQTAEAEALLRHGHTTELRELIEEIDQNLRDFDDGGYPPDSDELYGIYTDAVTRAAIPYGEQPVSVEEVARQLRNVGHNVPTLDLDSIAERTGITPLSRDYVTSKLDHVQPDPALIDLASARLNIRRAIASITEDSESAQSHLMTANATLTQVVEALRPDQPHADVAAAQESVQQASEKVAAVAETATKVDAEVTLYTKPDCPGCFATKRALDKAGVEYEEIDLTEHPDLAQQFVRQGKMQAPIVETSNDSWTGYNPTKLREHGLDYRSRQHRGNGPDTGQGHSR